ncbi:MAG: bifunctional alpha,alpha-trehalose-phosphate synthase (UDP-forming)/trehalose-phosphatase, partial [Bacteroidota bacterium]
SNRLPITVGKKGGELFLHPSAGGLATGLSSLDKNMDKIWCGWPGQTISLPQEQEQLRQELAKSKLIPVFLTDEDIKLYYEGFSNKVIWPHFHYFAQYTTYEESYWEAYERVNRRFATSIIEHLNEDDLIWVHDYQLMLLPALIREVFPKMSIGFFLHIPFPSYELFRLLPWRDRILDGILGADQIGFHTFDYMRHFLSAVYRISGFEHNIGNITVGKRMVKVDVFPMGIDYQKYAYPEQHEKLGDGRLKIQNLLAKKRKLILSIDRLDYTKGIPHRLRAFRQFIAENEQYRGKVSLILIVVPSRSNVGQYQELKHEVDTLVGQIDGEYRTFGWSPIQYYYRSFSFSDLTALYKVADIAMITPLRDGMNLVAKEYVASKERGKKGVLILSEFAGAANELTDALIINPRDTRQMVQSISAALEMSADEQRDRLEKMQAQLKKYTVRHWAEHFITQQAQLQEIEKSNMNNLLTDQQRLQLMQAYKTAKSRLIFLDYDGTLMGFQDDPSKVKPDQALLQLLQQLQSDPLNQVVVISGRDKTTLQNWLGHLDIDLSAEHGVWMKWNKTWTLASGLTRRWKSEIRPVLETLVERTPGSFIEEKDFSLTWHYRKIDKEFGTKRIRESRDVLLYLTSNHNIQVLEGNKVMEIKNASISKGKAASNWLDQKDWAFIMAIGDDHTDEDLFNALPPTAYTIKSGLAPSIANYRLKTIPDIRQLLKQLASLSSKK